MALFVAYFFLLSVLRLRPMESPLYQEYSKLLQEQGVQFQPFDLASITNKDVLLLIDCQNDFFPEGTVEDGGRFGVAVLPCPLVSSV